MSMRISSRNSPICAALAAALAVSPHR
jgi:hypothetical protein